MRHRGDGVHCSLCNASKITTAAIESACYFSQTTSKAENQRMTHPRKGGVTRSYEYHRTVVKSMRPWASRGVRGLP